EDDVLADALTVALEPAAPLLAMARRQAVRLARVEDQRAGSEPPQLPLQEGEALRQVLVRGVAHGAKQGDGKRSLVVLRRHSRLPKTGPTMSTRRWGEEGATETSKSAEASGSQSYQAVGTVRAGGE